MADIRSWLLNVVGLTETKTKGVMLVCEEKEVEDLEELRYLFSKGKLEGLGFKPFSLTKIEEVLQNDVAGGDDEFELPNQDKFNTDVEYFSFGDAKTFQSGMLGIVTLAMISRSIEEEATTNDGGIWSEEYHYIMHKEAQEEIIKNDDGTPKKSSSGENIVRDYGHNGMRFADFVVKAREIVEDITKAEVATLRMYTGSFYRPWNDALRFKKGVEQWATCLSVLYSATLKLARDAKNHRKLYRGLNESQMELPLTFLSAESQDEFAGGVELAYMSTTRDQNVAFDFSGGREHKGSILILEVALDSRGADVEFLSMFPLEKEILFPPCTALTCTGVKDEGVKRYVKVKPAMSIAKADVDDIAATTTVPQPRGGAGGAAAPPPPPPQSEFHALIDLRDSTNYAGWTQNKRGWDKLEPTMSLAEAAACEPEGVTFGPDGRMTEINLSVNALEGPIPDFSKCTALMELRLQRNALEGSIPDFSKCTALKSLWLNGNFLEGEIPDFSKCTALQGLNLAFNKLTGSIPDFSKCTALQALDLQGNKLTGSIPDFSKCTALQALDLQGNKLTGNVPKSLKALTQLSALYLYNNQLKVPPQASLDSDGDMCYDTRSKVEAFLAVL